MGRQRKLPDGMWQRGSAYYARFRANGRLVRKRLSTDFTVACELLNTLRARADKADFGQVDNDCPWSELKAEFLRWARQSIRRPRDYESDLARFEAFVTVRSIRQVTQALVLAYREYRLSQSIMVKSRKKDAVPLARKVSPRTVNREVNTVNNMLNKGVDWRLLGYNPIEKLKPLRHDTLRKDRRPLTVDEVAALFEASPEHLRPVWRMFTCTAIRKGELVGLRFSDIDFENKTVVIRAATAKNHKAREIPLDDTMLTMLVELLHRAKSRRAVGGPTPEQTRQQAAQLSRDHVFVSRANTPLNNNLLRRFYAVCKRAGINDAGQGGAVDIHSLRVTCATLMLQNGANPKDVQAILGHSTLAMTMKVYAKATECGKRAAVNALPFACSTTPAHAIPVPKAHSLSTSSKRTAENDRQLGLVRATG